ncbi:signal recognition particle receptor subunit alpha, partial [Helicobacter japonicus]
MIANLAKTLQKTTQHLTALLGSKKDKYTKEQLEDILIECDVDYELVESILDNL